MGIDKPLGLRSYIVDSQNIDKQVIDGTDVVVVEPHPKNDDKWCGDHRWYEENNSVERRHERIVYTVKKDCDHHGNENHSGHKYACEDECSSYALPKEAVMNDLTIII